LFEPEDGGTMLPRNIGNSPEFDTFWQTRSPDFAIPKQF